MKMSKPRKFLYILVVGFVLVKLSNMTFNKIVTVVLPQTEFSIYLIVINSVAMITGISALGMSTSLMRYLVRFDSRNAKKEAKKLLSTTLIYTNAFQTIILCFLFIGAHIGLVLFQDSNYIYLLILIVVSSNIQLIIAFLIVVAYSRFDSIGFFCLTACPSFLLLGFTAFQVLEGSLGSFFLIFANITANGLIMLPFLFRLLKTTGFSGFSFTLFKDSLKFAGPLVITGQLETFSQFFLLTFLYYYYPEEVAVYIIGLSIANLIQLIQQVISTTYSPLVIKYYEGGRYKYLNYFVNQTSKIYITFAILLLLVIYAFSPFLIVLLSTKEYLLGTIIVLFLSATNLIQTGRRMTSFGYLITAKSNQIALVRVITVIPKIIIGLILIPEMGMVGLAITLFFYHVTLLFGEFLVSQNLYKIEYQKSPFVRIIFLAIITFSLAFFLYNSVRIHFELSLLLSAIFYTGGILLLKVITAQDYNFIKFVFFKGKLNHLELE